MNYQLKEEGAMDAPYGTGEDSQKRCNCRKAKCLKLYCVCFSAGVYCGGCACRDCMNTVQYQEAVWNERQRILQRSPRAFAPKVEQRQSGDVLHKKGCRCRKSRCLKKYCECYDAGVPCSNMCRCDDCHNSGDGAGTQQSLQHLSTLLGIPDQLLIGTGAVAVATIVPAVSSKPKRSARQLARRNSRRASSPGQQAEDRSGSPTDDEVHAEPHPAAGPGEEGADGEEVAVLDQPLPSGTVPPLSPQMDGMATLLDAPHTYSTASAALAQLLAPLSAAPAMPTPSSSLCLGLPGSMAPSPMAVPGLGDVGLGWPPLHGTTRREIDSPQMNVEAGVMPAHPTHSTGLTPSLGDLIAPNLPGTLQGTQCSLASLPLPPLLRRDVEVGCRGDGAGEAHGAASTPVGPSTAVSMHGPSPFSLAQPYLLPTLTPEGNPGSRGSVEVHHHMLPAQPPPATARLQSGTASAALPACASAQPQQQQANVLPGRHAWCVPQQPQVGIPYLMQPQVLLSQPEAARCLAQQLGLDETHQLAALKAAQILQAMLNQASVQLHLLEPGFLPTMPSHGGGLVAAKPAPQPSGNLTHAVPQAAAPGGLEPAASVSQQPPSLNVLHRPHTIQDQLGQIDQAEDNLVDPTLPATAPFTQQQQQLQQQASLQQTGSASLDVNMGRPGGHQVHATAQLQQAPSTSAASCPQQGAVVSAGRVNMGGGVGGAEPTMSNAAAGQFQHELLQVPARPASAPAVTTVQPATGGRGSKAVRLGSGSFRFTGASAVQLTSAGGAESQPQPVGGLLYSSMNPTRTSPAGYATTIGADIGKRPPTRLAYMTSGADPAMTSGGTPQKSNGATRAAASAVLTTNSERAGKRARCDLDSSTPELEACSDLVPLAASGPGEGHPAARKGGSKPNSPARASSSRRAPAHSSGASRPNKQGRTGSGRGEVDCLDSANEVEAMQALFDLGSQVGSQQPLPAPPTATAAGVGATAATGACASTSSQGVACAANSVQVA